jgi:excisionase family DNA binding protein
MPKQSPPRASDPTQLLDIGEVADALGVSVRHVRRLVFERRIPYVKWGHLVRFGPADVAAWLENKRRPAQPA